VSIKTTQEGSGKQSSVDQRKKKVSITKGVSIKATQRGVEQKRKLIKATQRGVEQKRSVDQSNKRGVEQRVCRAKGVSSKRCVEQKVCR
jgi:hypothetical protein